MVCDFYENKKGWIDLDLDFLNNYFVPVIAGICFCVGFVIKKWIPNAAIDNKLIPTICGILGLVIALIFNWESGITPEIILSGLFSGLAATGLHQAFTSLAKEKYDESEIAEDDTNEDDQEDDEIE